MNNLITINEVKMFCKIDDNFEDELLNFFIDVSIDYLKNRLGIDEIYDEIKLQFKMCCLRLINENYNDRDFFLSSNKQKVSMSENILIKSMINNMSYIIAFKKESETLWI